MTRENVLTVRLSLEEREALDAAARHEDIPTAQLARRAIKRELERLKTEAKKGKRS